MATANIEVILPEFFESEAVAAGLLAELPEELHGVSVTVDCGQASAATRNCTDQLCRELLEVRGAEELVLRRPPESMANATLGSSYLRGLRGLILISR